MAWAEQLPGSGRWRGLYRDGSGRQRTAPGGPFTTKALASREAAVAEDTARRRPGRPAARAGRATWGSWADQWWPTRKVEPGTAARDQSRRVTHLDPRWDTVRLDAIAREAVQEWVDELVAAGLAPSTVANAYHLFSASMKAAVLAGKVAASPCVSIELPRRLPADERYLTEAEVAAICHYLDGRDALLVWFLVGTGLRWGEAVGAHRHRLHLDTVPPRLDVIEVWDIRTREIKPYPKGRRKRSVPLPGWLVDKLRVWLDETPPRSSCGAQHRRGSPRCRSGLLFPGRDDIPIDYDSWRRTRFIDACAKAGVGGVTIHDLRHTYASWLLQSRKVSIEGLSELLGHASIATTQRYSHLAETQWAGVLDALEERVAPHLPHGDTGEAVHDPSVVRFRRPEGGF